MNFQFHSFHYFWYQFYQFIILLQQYFTICPYATDRLLYQSLLTLMCKWRKVVYFIKYGKTTKLFSCFPWSPICFFIKITLQLRVRKSQRFLKYAFKLKKGKNSNYRPCFEKSAMIFGLTKCQLFATKKLYFWNQQIIIAGRNRYIQILL